MLPGPSKEPLKSGFCTGLVVGVAYAARDVCPPDSATNEQGVRVVVAYIDRIPARMHEPFAKLSIEALRAAWPCKR